METGGLVGIQSLNFVMQGLLTQMAKTELIIMKGNQTSSSILKKHTSVNGNPTLTADSDSIALDISFGNDLPNGIYKYLFDLHFSSSKNIKVFLYGDCGGVGYNASTFYMHWNNSYARNERQTNVNGGYFHGDSITFSGEFRLYGGYLTNLGSSRALNNAGIFNEFVSQKIEKISSEPKLLALSMTWLFENETNASLGMTTDSYFYFERVNTI